MDQTRKRPRNLEEAFFENLAMALASASSSGACSNPKRLIAITQKAFAIESFTVTDPDDIILRLQESDRDDLFKKLKKTYPEEMAQFKKGELDTCGRGLDFMNAINLALNTYIAQELCKVNIDKSLHFTSPFTITHGKDDFLVALKALPEAKGPTGALAQTFAKHAINLENPTPADTDALLGIAEQLTITIDLEAPWKTRCGLAELADRYQNENEASEDILGHYGAGNDPYYQVSDVKKAAQSMEENIKEHSAQICFRDSEGGWCNCLIPTLFTNSRVLIDGYHPKMMFLDTLGTALYLLQEKKQEKLN
jgi:hypothetical protein